MVLAMETRKAKKTEEERFGVIPEPEHTCPMIDEAIALVNEAKKLSCCCDRLGEEDLRERLGTIETVLNELYWFRGDGLLERIRGRASDLRQWGGEWRELHLRLSEEHADLVDDAKMGRDL